MSTLKLEVHEDFKNVEYGLVASATNTLIHLKTEIELSFNSACRAYGYDKKELNTILEAYPPPLIQGVGCYPESKETHMLFPGSRNVYQINKSEYIDFADTHGMSTKEIQHYTVMLNEWLEIGFPDAQQRAFLLDCLHTKMHRIGRRFPKILCFMDKVSDIGKTTYCMAIANLFGFEEMKNIATVTGQRLAAAYDDYSGTPVIIVEDLKKQKDWATVESSLMDLTNMEVCTRNPKSKPQYRVPNRSLVLINSNDINSFKFQTGQKRIVLFDMATDVTPFKAFNEHYDFIKEVIKKPENYRKLIYAFRLMLWHDKSLNFVEKDDAPPESEHWNDFQDGNVHPSILAVAENMDSVNQALQSQSPMSSTDFRALLLAQVDIADHRKFRLNKNYVADLQEHGCLVERRPLYGQKRQYEFVYTGG